MHAFRLKYVVAVVTAAVSGAVLAQPSTPTPSTPKSRPNTPLSVASAISDNSATTLNQVVEQTLLSNPEIQARYHDFRASFEGQNVARGGFLPQVNAQGNYGREWQNHLPGQGSASWNRPGYNLELRQLLFDGFRTSNDVKQAGFEKLSRFYDLLGTSDDMAFNAVQAYVDVQRFRDLELLARQNYTLHEETLKQIRERADSGVGRRVDLEQAGGRLALAQTNLMTESANLNDVTSRFRRVTGHDVPVTLAPTPKVDDKLPLNPKDFNDSLRSNPSFLSKQALLQAADAGTQSSKGAAYSPKFEFVASTGTDTSQPGPDFKDVHSTNVGLTMTYALYRGGSDSARIRQTAAQAYAARDVRDFTCRNVQQDLAVAWNNIIHLRKSLPFLQDHEVATTKVRDAYRQQFQIGQRTLLDLLDTENELFESRRALTTALYDLETAEYKWLSLSHKLMPVLGLQPAHDETPEENGKLQVSDDVIRLCNSTVPDASNLEPVKVIYNNGTNPPDLIPASAPARSKSTAPAAGSKW